MSRFGIYTGILDALFKPTDWGTNPARGGSAVQTWQGRPQVQPRPGSSPGGSHKLGDGPVRTPPPGQLPPHAAPRGLPARGRLPGPPPVAGQHGSRPATRWERGSPPVRASAPGLAHGGAVSPVAVPGHRDLSDGRAARRRRGRAGAACLGALGNVRLFPRPG